MSINVECASLTDLRWFVKCYAVLICSDDVSVQTVWVSGFMPRFSLLLVFVCLAS